MSLTSAARPRMVLIDGANYAFRAYHALPRLSNAAGQPTNAVYGFAQLLARYVREIRPDYLAVVWDAPGPSWRRLKYPEYKAQRKPMDPDLRDQLPWFKPLAEAFNVAFLSVPTVEADDVIATLALRYRDTCDVQILSTDKDLMQIVGGGITLEDSIRAKLYDPPAVVEKWGVPPERLRDLLALMGDSSDNVPGVPGIGPKRASDLINSFGSLDALYARLPELGTSKVRASLEAHQAEARLSLELVTLVTDVEVGAELPALALRAPDEERCRALFTELEFHALLKKYGLSSRSAEAGAVLVDRASWPDLKAALAAPAPVTLTVIRAREGAPPRYVGVRDEAGTCFVAPDGGEVPYEELGAALLDAIGRDGKVVGYELKADVRALWRSGLTADGRPAFGTPAGDVMIEAYLGNSGRSSFDLSDLAASVLGSPLEAIPDEAGPAAFGRVAARLTAIHGLGPRFREELTAAGHARLLTEIELPLVPVLAEMERVGITLDVERLGRIGGTVDADLGRLHHEICHLAGDPGFNPNSPKQLQKVLFEDLKLPVVKRTKTGPSTDMSVLEALAEEHPLPDKIVEYRSLSKLKNTYLDVLPTLVRDGRVHTTFNQAVAATGRLSSSDPNLQNIPVRTPLGRQIREAFVAAPGHKLLSADYSQIELRLMAHLSDDPIMKDAFFRGEDVHARTAMEIYGLLPGLVTQEHRRSAKAINFGVLYGMGAHRLARDLGISRREAQDFIDRYFERFSGVRAFLDRTVEAARRDGYVSTLEGRRRYLPDISAKQFNVRANAERMATNAPLQGSAADLIKIAMVSIDRRLRREHFGARMLLQVHDELLFEVPEAEVEVLKQLVKSEMEGVRSLSVPLVVDVGVGDNWAEAH